MKRGDGIARGGLRVAATACRLRGVLPEDLSADGGLCAAVVGTAEFGADQETTRYSTEAMDVPEAF